MSSLTFRKVRSAELSDDDAIKVELFCKDDGSICAWFLGPVRLGPMGIAIPYVPRSQGITASVAILRAVHEAKKSGLPICIVDPEDIWERAWRG